MIFVRQVGCLATCGMHSLESCPVHRPEKVVVAAGVHPVAVLQIDSCIFKVLCFAVNLWKNACRSTDGASSRLVSSACPSQARRLRCHIPHFGFWIGSPQHLFQVTLGMGHNPDAVGPCEFANLMFLVLPKTKGLQICPCFISSTLSHNLRVIPLSPPTGMPQHF